MDSSGRFYPCRRRTVSFLPYFSCFVQSWTVGLWRIVFCALFDGLCSSRDAGLGCGKCPKCGWLQDLLWLCQWAVQPQCEGGKTTTASLSGLDQRKVYDIVATAYDTSGNQYP
jgi:hypothetical protein